MPIKAANNILELIGNTPLVKCHKIAAHVKADIYLKLEYLNPGSSVKDRPALQIIRDAEESGHLKPGGTIVEATSGNTGMGLALAAANLGYKCIFVMPDKMSEEKIRSLRAVGARVVVCPTAVEPDDPRSYYKVAERLSIETPNAFLANQYHNASNPKAHVHSTGPELWEQTDGEIDVFVSSMGTGGTISGTGRYLKEKNPDVQIVGVDPIGSIYYDYFKTGKMTEAHTYLVEGFGEDFLPSTMHFDVVDEVIRVSDRECFEYTRRLVREEGILTGGSSGGALCAAIKYAERVDKHMNIVVIMCDSFSRYMSKIFDDEWMRENGLIGPDPNSDRVSDILNTVGAHKRAVITARPQEKLTEVIEKMKKHGISQLPMLDGDKVVGIVAENDVLNYLLTADKEGGAAADVAEPNFAVVDPSTSVSIVGQFFKQNKVVVVYDDTKLTGILTKIDFIDHVSRKIA